MSEQPDPHKVMLNGAAVSLLTHMFNGLKADLAQTEERLMRHLEARFDAHEEIHTKDDDSALSEHTRMKERINHLEGWTRDMDVSNQLRSARRDGQLWLPMTVSQIVERHWKIVAAIIAAIGSAVAINLPKDFGM